MADTTECPHCGSTNTVIGKTANRLFCQDCGHAFEEFMDDD